MLIRSELMNSTVENLHNEEYNEIPINRYEWACNIETCNNYLEINVTTSKHLNRTVKSQEVLLDNNNIDITMIIL